VKLALRHHNEPRLVYTWVATYQAPCVYAGLLDNSFVRLGLLRLRHLDYHAQSVIGYPPVGIQMQWLNYSNHNTCAAVCYPNLFSIFCQYPLFFPIAVA